MKRDFNPWLKSLGASVPVKSLTELRNWNLAHRNAGALKFGQAQLDNSDEMDVEVDRARYEADRAKDVALSAAQGIDAIMQSARLDALLFPGASGALLSARPGYPRVLVPFGLVPNAPSPPLPEGFNAKPAPFGVSFAGSACSEPRLIELAYAFEQATRKRISRSHCVDGYDRTCSQPPRPRTFQSFRHLTPGTARRPPIVSAPLPMMPRRC